MQNPIQARAALTGGPEGHAGRWPFITLMTAACVLLSALVLPLEMSLQVLSFDYTAITNQYEVWRLITGHLVHSSYDHLFWDLLAFSACCYYLETRAYHLLVPGLLAGLVSVNLYLLSPYATIEYYSGLSGVLYCLFLLSGWHWAQSQNSLIGAVPLALLLGKTLVEWMQGDTVFVNQGWQLLNEAHLSGLAGGVGCLLWHRLARYRNIILIAGMPLLLSGCSIAAYSPVVLSDLSGAGDKDLSQQAPFSQYIGQPMHFTINTSERWYLKRFRSGRLTIEPATEHEQKTRVCSLNKPDSYLIIKRIYYKQNYHQNYYDADVRCSGQTYLQVPLNIWSDNFADAISPADTKKQP